MDWRKFFNAVVIAVLLAGLSYYRYSNEIPSLMMEFGLIPTSENVSFQQHAALLLFAITMVPPFAIWAILIFLHERELLPEWRWPWTRRTFQDGASRGGSLDHLLTLCGGDKDQAERLIQFELKRDSKLKRSQAIQKAADRLQYDRSR